MRMAGFLVFLLFLAAFALLSIRDRPTGNVDAPAGTASLAIPGDWAAEELFGGDVTTGKAPTFSLDSAGRLSGDAGCNFFNGTVDLGISGFRVGNLRATRKACEPAMMAVEQALFRALGAAQRYQVNDETLVLVSEDGSTVARFIRTPPEA